MKISNLMVILGVLKMFSCENVNDKKYAIENILDKQFTIHREVDKYRYFICIVNATYYDGCHSCIEKVKYFCKTNQGKKNLSVVISTKLKRNLRREYSYEERMNAHLDTTGVIISHLELFGTMPLVLFYKNGKIVKYTNINPQNIDTTLALAKTWLRD